MRRGGREHLLATVLFTDIVGSSEIASELGDRRWRVLLDRHHAIVRRALKRSGGREIDNAGDGFFASFDDQADAIRCACAISDAVRVLGIDIRAGLHVGQSEIVGKKLGGTSVNVAARVMSHAAAGEVLVSGVMRDLVAGSGFTFEDRGVHELKGIPGEWRLYAITAVDADVRDMAMEPGVATRIRESIAPPATPDRKGARLAVAATTVLAIALISLAILRRSEPLAGPPASVEIPRSSLVRIDPDTFQIQSVWPLIAPKWGQLTAVPERHEVWVLNPTSQQISVVDAETNQAERTIAGFGGATRVVGYGIVYHAGSVWVTGNDNTVNEIGTLNTTETIVEVPGQPALLAAGFGRIWVQAADHFRDPFPAVTGPQCRVVAIGPHQGGIVFQAGMPCSANGIAAGLGAVWVSAYTNTSLSPGHVWRIDPRTGATIRIEVGHGPSDIGIGFGDVWVSNLGDGTVSRIEPAIEKAVATIPVGETSSSVFASGIAETDDGMWVVVPTTRELVRIDPDTNRVDERISLDTFGIPSGLLEAFGSLWLTVY